MNSNNYHLINKWHVNGTVKEVVDIICDGEALTSWWPAGFVSVKELASGDADGIGKVVRLCTKGWFPYTLLWQFRISALHVDGFTLVASGDFEGRGIWTFRQNGSWVDITYDWKISVEKPLVRHLSFIMKPLFSANHYWVMARGEESLKRELLRRRATTEQERLQVPPPPSPSSPMPLALITLSCIAVLTYLGYITTKAIAK